MGVDDLTMATSELIGKDCGTWGASRPGAANALLREVRAWVETTLGAQAIGFTQQTWTVNYR